MQGCLKRTLVRLALVFLLPGIANARAPISKNTRSVKGYSSLLPQNYQVSNINNMTSWIRMDGLSGHTPDGFAGGIYPRGSAAVVYQDGMIWGGIVNDVRNPNLPSLRAGGQYYSSGTQPGHILVPGTATDPPVISDPNAAFVYRIRKDWQSLSIGDPELIRDVADVYAVSIDSVTIAMQQAVLHDYAFSWNNWPVDLGAPYVDTNGNGIYDSGVDEPGLPGADQIIWLVINDAPAEDLFTSPPIGLELQITLWGYKSGGPLGQAQYKRYRIINKSGLEIEDMYVCWWADMDIGDFINDLAGCSEELQLGYTYNGYATDEEFDTHDLPPSAAGFVLLQGPIIPSPGDTAWFDFEWRPGFRNLPMTSHSFYAPSGIPIDPIDPYELPVAWYNHLQGFQLKVLQEPYYFTTGPNAGQPTKFPLNGNPLTGSGDVDGVALYPSDRRTTLSTGAFHMQPGDTQEVVLALVGGNTGSGDHLSSVSAFFQNVEAILDSYGQPVTPYPVAEFEISAATPTTTTAVLRADLGYLGSVFAAEAFFAPVTGAGSTFFISLFDDGMHHDGATGDGVWGNEITVNNQKLPYSATVTVALGSGDVRFPGVLNGLRFRPTPIVQNLRVVWENALQDGQVNNGETVHLRFDMQNIDQLNAIDAAFVRNLQPVSQRQLLHYPGSITGGATVSDPALFLLAEAPAAGDSLELAYTVIFDRHAVTMRSTVPVVSAPPPGWGDTLKVASVHGPVRNITPIIADPAQLNDHHYRITFDSAGYDVVWQLWDVTAGVQKLQDQPLAPAGDLYFPHPVVDGVQYRLIAPDPGVGEWSVPAGSRCISWVNASGLALEGFNGAIGWNSPYQFFGGGLPAVKPNELKDILLIFAQVPDGSVNYNPNFDQSGGDPNVSFGYRFGRAFFAPPAQPQFAPYIVNTSGSGYTYQDFTRSVPLSAWDVTDPVNPRRLAVGHLENNATNGLVDGKYWPPSFNFFDNISGSGPREWLFIFNADYSETPDPSLQVELIGNRVPIMYWLSVTRNGETPFSPGNSGEDQFFFQAKIPNIPGDTLIVTATPAAIEPETLPTAFELAQNYPNPFNPTTEIRYAIASPADVTLEIYNVLGQKVKTLVNERQHSGRYRIAWDGSNDGGVRVASGVYFYRLSAGAFVKSRKMILLR